MKEDFVIIQDSREQNGYNFENSIIKALKTGDYAPLDYENEIAVERKSAMDAISSVLTGRKRFEKEWIRAMKLKRFFVVIEGTQDVIKRELIRLKCMGKIRNVNWSFKSVINTYIHWSVKYNIPVFFCFGREEAKRMTYELLRAYVKNLENGKIPIDEVKLKKRKLAKEFVSSMEKISGG